MLKLRAGGGIIETNKTNKTTQDSMANKKNRACVVQRRLNMFNRGCQSDTAVVRGRDTWRNGVTLLWLLLVDRQTGSTRSEPALAAGSRQWTRAMGAEILEPGCRDSLSFSHTSISLVVVDLAHSQPASSAQSCWMGLSSGLFAEKSHSLTPILCMLTQERAFSQTVPPTAFKLEPGLI